MMTDESLKYLRALVYLQLEARTGSAFAKPELLLSQAGFSNKEIADMLGKSATAVAKAVSRAKKALAEEAKDNE